MYAIGLMRGVALSFVGGFRGVGYNFLFLETPDFIFGEERYFRRGLVVIIDGGGSEPIEIENENEEPAPKRRKTDRGEGNDRNANPKSPWSGSKVPVGERKESMEMEVEESLAKPRKTGRKGDSSTPPFAGNTPKTPPTRRRRINGHESGYEGDHEFESV